MLLLVVLVATQCRTQVQVAVQVEQSTLQVLRAR
jgi:hypothetical protein